jgi:hypothetical protein
MIAEISFDLVMDDDMDFVEGAYRLPGCVWQVFVFARRDGPEPQVKRTHWTSGVTGLFVKFPRHQRLNQVVVERVLSAALGVNGWTTVRGPDSIQLR